MGLKDLISKISPFGHSQKGETERRVENAPRQTEKKNLQTSPPTRHGFDQNIEINARETALLLKTDPSVRLIDVREDHERRLAYIEGSELITQELAQEMIANWPKDTPIIFHCHHGVRSLNAASHFINQGFTNVRSMKGGIDAWSLEVDLSVPRY